MILRPPSSTRTASLFPFTPLFRSTPTPSQPAAVTAPVSYLASSPSGGNLDALPVHYKTADANNRITGTVITTAAEVRITDIRYDGSSYTITARDQAGRDRKRTRLNSST